MHFVLGWCLTGNTALLILQLIVAAVKGAADAEAGRNGLNTWNSLLTRIGAAAADDLQAVLDTNIDFDGDCGQLQSSILEEPHLMGRGLCWARPCCLPILRAASL